jgi:anti-anti-sigma regulatory factor
MMQISRSEAGNSLKLSGAVDMNGVDTLRGSFIALLNCSQTTGAGDGPAIDLSEVQSCDTAAAQLLWSLHKTAHQSGRKVHFIVPSDAVAETFAALGLPVGELFETRS